MASVVGLVVCLAVGVVVYEYLEGRAARAENAVALDENRMLAEEIRLANSQLEDATRRKRQADEACAAARKRAEELAAMKIAPAVVVAKPDAKAKVIDARQVRRQLLLTNPDYLSAMIEMQRLELCLRYGALYKKLGLTPQQIDRFEEAVAAHDKAGYEIQAVAFTQGVGSSRENNPAWEAACQPKIKEEQTQFLNKVRAVLGESGYKEFSANYACESACLTTNQLVQDLFYSASPLTVAQADAVTRLLSSNSSKRDFDWDAVFAQVPGVLTVPQVAVLKQRVDATRLHQELCSFMAKAAAHTP